MKTLRILFSFLFYFCIFLSATPVVIAVEPAPRISDREIIESLMRLEAGIQANAMAIQANADAIKANANAIKQNSEAISSLRTEMKSDIASLRNEMKSDIASLRNEVKSDIASLRNEMKSDIGSLRNEVKSDIGSLRNEVKSDIASLRSDISGFLLWGFGILFSGMFILVGFILWDRRSTIKPLKDDIDDLEERKVNRIIGALKKLSEDDARFAQALRSVGLL